MREFIQLFKEKGMRTFLWVWFGQFVSIMGTGMTRFGLMIWAYQQTESATTLALLGTFNYIPYLLASPLAGVVVDRWDRRKVMLVADLLAGLVTAGLLGLYLGGGLEIWHLYLAEGLSGFFDAFQGPAYSAAVTVLVPKGQLARTNGLRALAANGSRVLAPLLAGALLAAVGIQMVMIIDLVTFVFATLVLAVVHVPRPQESAEGRASRGRVLDEMRVGFAYIQQHHGLRGLLLVMLAINLLASLTYFSILPALILARSGQNEWALGIVQAVLGAGGVAGALLLSTWGGPRKKIHGVLAFGAASFLLGDLLFAVGRGLPVWVAAALCSTVFIPFISGGEQTIWQLKVAQDLQGRVFSVKMALQQVLMPLGYLLGGVLADQVFEPAMLPGGALAGTFGGLVGTGPGAGMGLMFLFTCIGGTLVCLSGYLYAPLRNVESDMPDAVVQEEPAAQIEPAHTGVAYTN